MNDAAGSTNAASFSQSSDDVFARIAGRYDRLCDVFSLGIHRLWKRTMAKRMAAHPASVVFDAASGTGDIPLRFLRSSSASTMREVWVTDTCPQMLAIAGRRLRDLNVRIALRNAEHLDEVQDNSVDLYSISFGMKICDRHRVIAEALRVLRPGGTFFCLEASRIVVPALHAAYLGYMDRCLPLIGRLAANGDASAYDYLLRGVHAFPDQETFATELRDAGFARVSYKSITLGIVALHEAVKPE